MLALAGVLARPWVDVALSGAATVEQLHSNLRAVEIEWSDELEDELSGLAEPPDRYWDTRARPDLDLKSVPTFVPHPASDTRPGAGLRLAPTRPSGAASRAGPV